MLLGNSLFYPPKGVYSPCGIKWVWDFKLMLSVATAVRIPKLRILPTIHSGNVGPGAGGKCSE